MGGNQEGKSDEKFAYKKNQMSTDRESGRGNKRARVTRGSQNRRPGKDMPQQVPAPVHGQ
jgi:hypothetical protein